MIGPSGTRVSAAGSVGDWPCLAEMMTVVLPASPSCLDVRRHQGDLAVQPVQRAGQQRAGDLPAGEVAAGQPVGGGQLLRGGDRLEVHPEDRRGADLVLPAVVEAVDLIQDRLHLVAVVLHGGGVVGGPVCHRSGGRAMLLISGVKKSSTPLPDGPSNIW